MQHDPLLQLTASDLTQLAEIERRIMESQSINKVSDIPKIPFKTIDDVRHAKEIGAITFGAPYQPNHLATLCTPSERRIHAFWLFSAPIAAVAFVIAALMMGRFILLLGALTTAIGFLFSSPAAPKSLVKPLVGVLWIPTLYFAFTNPVWAWVLGGFEAGYIFASTARLHFSICMENRALLSDIFFCYLYLNRVVLIRDNKTNLPL